MQVRRESLDVRQMAARIVAWFDQATDAERYEGERWYTNAHDIAAAFAGAHWSDKVSRRLDVAAAALAVLSAGISWGQTINAVADLYRTGVCKGYTWGRNCAKANAIMEAAVLLGGAADPLTTTFVDPKDGKEKPALSGPKVTSFFWCIYTGGKTGHVTIDRHAVHIALGQRVDDQTRSYLLRQLKGNATRPGWDGYDTFRRAYMEATALINSGRRLAHEPTFTASQVQAITWVAYRNRLEGRARASAGVDSPLVDLFA
jgi:hypothetical protein